MKNNFMDFPAEVREDIATISENNGVLRAARCQRICQQLSISIESLMVRLLPLAACYSKAPISSVHIGAVVRGAKKDADGMANLYLGSNLEFPGQALCYSVHAEQAAISNAWSYDETGIDAIAVSAPPCGFCRQFLYEVIGTGSLPVLLPCDYFDSTPIEQPYFKSAHKDFVSVDLSHLLPVAFGPLDLGYDGLLMEPTSSLNPLKLLKNNDDRLVNKALQAASLCYAPYTKNYAGCALKLTNGEIFVGRYAENAAHNPCLSPFSAALSKMILGCQEFVSENIERVVLVESKSTISQKTITKNLLTVYAKGVKLEYFLASADGHGYRN